MRFDVQHCRHGLSLFPCYMLLAFPHNMVRTLTGGNSVRVPLFHLQNIQPLKLTLSDCTFAIISCVCIVLACECKQKKYSIALSDTLTNVAIYGFILNEVDLQEP